MSDEELEAYVRKKYKDLPEGVYNIGTDKFACQTGKEGYINFEIALHKKVREYGL